MDGPASNQPHHINIYPGPDSSFVLYLDDGETTNAQNHGSFRLTTISHTGIPGGQRVRILRTHDQFNPPEQFYFVSFLGTNQPVSVQIAGNPLPDVGDSASLWTSVNNAYYYNASIKTTFVKILDLTADITLQVTF
jgi:hypothetical protein